MNILFDINHPAHVHLFRNAIKSLKAKGYGIIVVARDKEVTYSLLKQYGIDYIPLSKPGQGLLGLAWELISRQFKLLPIVLKYKIKLGVSVTGASSIYIMRIFRIPFLIFTDSEAAGLQNDITYPFATAIYTPDTYRDEIGKKHHRYAGFHELAYLHPDVFKPRSEILGKIGLSPNDRFFICRFIAWKAAHDVGRFGFNLAQKIQIVEYLKKFGKVLITSEKQLEPELEPYRISIAASEFLDVLFFAEMLITDSQTVTTEAALCGTPAIRYNSFVGPNDMGNFIELEKRYKLIFNFNKFGDVVEKMEFLLNYDGLKRDWQVKRDALLSEKINVNEFMVETIIQHMKGIYA